MIYGFARQSDGYAKVYSEVGNGTTVKLYLRRLRAKAELQEEPVASLRGQPATHGEIVLVIKDETVVRGLVVELLGELGNHTLEAIDGPSGLDILRSEQRIDLLITDIGLPGLKGRQVVDAIRGKRPEMKVLFMTGYAENATRSAGFLEPGMAMITKPFAMDALAARVQDILE